jgi:rod shape-determining protein MreC
MPVVTPEGILGHVVRATGSAADVLLVSDPNSRVGARIQRSRARVTAAGGGERQNLRLANALRTEDLMEGDVVVTSGADGIFPTGLRVGQVLAVQRKTTGMFQEAQIVPAVDATKVEEVFVLAAPSLPSMEAVR